MIRKCISTVTILALSLPLAHAQASSPMIYPAKGQPAAQQDRDRYECHDWARSQSGFDPSQSGQAASPAAAPSQPANAGPSLNTMLRGAAGGAAIAEVTNHDAGRGAAAGVLGASVIGRAREQQMMQAKQQQAAAQQQAARGQARSAYERGFAACLEARGYVVK